MSSLPRRLKNPKTWLLLFASLFVLAVLDSFRAPSSR